MASRRRLEKYGEHHERPKIIDTQDAFLLLPVLLLLMGVVALVVFVG
jgi:hypothetical protein